MREAPPLRPTHPDHVSALAAAFAVCLIAVGTLHVTVPPAIAAPLPAAATPIGIVVDAQGRPTAATDRPRPIIDRLIVKLRAGSDACVGCRLRSGQRLGSLGVGSRLDALLAAAGARDARPLLAHGDDAARAQARTRFPARAARSRGASAAAFDRTWLVTVRAVPDLGAVAHRIAADPAVEYCEPDLIMEPALVPNDPLFASAGSWGQPFDDLWGPKRIDAPAAWDVTRGAGVLVAVVDTGVDDGHPDLAANMWTNPGEIPGNAIDDDGNGFVDDVRGWDFADNDDDPHDDYSHGTHVAGTIAAVGNNGIGITGIAYESKVMAVRALGTFGYGYSSDLAAGILYAVDNGADVINASWGGGGFSQTIADAVHDAHDAGVVFVAAGGNSATDTSLFFPAANPDAITVSAFTHADARASFSNYGLKLDVAAPGGGDLPPPKNFSSSSILSLLASGLAYGNDPESALVLTSGGAQYARFAGTSMAAPHVSGVAALAIASHPGISVEQVRQLLRTTADDVGTPGRDDDSGDGMVNAAAAVAAPLPLEAHIATPAGGTLIGPLIVSVVGSAQGPGFASYTLDYRPDDDPDGWVTIAGPVATPVAAAELAAWDASVVTDGQYVLRLRVERPGQAFVDQVAVGVKNAALTAPASMAALRSDAAIEIRGTAAGAGFVGYTVEIRRPAIHGDTWHTDDVTLASAGPVYGDLLATLDTASLTEGDRFDFRLTVTNAAGTTSVIRRGIVIDPTLRAGWPQQVFPNSDREYLTLADLDGDGGQEVLVGSGSDVVVFQADGSIRPGWPQSVALGDIFAGTHSSPVVADITGDAAPEVVAISRDHVFAWSADGTPVPGFPVFSFMLSISGNEWLSAGDVDGNGKDEIVCTSGHGAQVIRGDGATVMSSSTPIHGPAAVGDVFGDSASELAYYLAKHANILTGSGTLKLVAGTGGLLAQRNVKGTTYTRTWLADMDGDGRLDMVTLGMKPNSFQPIKVTAVTADGKNLPLRKPVVKGLRMAAARQLAFSDLDRDGRAEAWAYKPIAATGNFEERFDHFAPYTYKKSPVVLPVVEHRLFKYPLFNDGAFATAIGDIDGDGVQELVGGMVGQSCGANSNACTSTSIRRAMPVQHADGTLLPKFPKPVPQYFTEEPGFPIYVTAFSDDPMAATPSIGDLDGDGLKEIVWFDPETTRIFVWNVEGTPGPLLADWPMYAHDPRHSNTLPPTVP